MCTVVPAGIVCPVPPQSKGNVITTILRPRSSWTSLLRAGQYSTWLSYIYFVLKRKPNRILYIHTYNCFKGYFKSHNIKKLIAFQLLFFHADYQFFCGLRCTHNHCLYYYILYIWMYVYPEIDSWYWFVVKPLRLYNYSPRSLLKNWLQTDDLKYLNLLYTLNTSENSLRFKELKQSLTLNLYWEFHDCISSIKQPKIRAKLK